MCEGSKKHWVLADNLILICLEVQRGTSLTIDVSLQFPNLLVGMLTMSACRTTRLGVPGDAKTRMSGEATEEVGEEVD